MLASQLRQKYLDFFIQKGHKVIPAASLVPENDSSTLFTSSGMQPLIPYLLGQSYPLGKRLVNSQPSFRTEDIEEVGDRCHTTFFEMLGNWSLGDYWKEEQLTWVWEFLTKELGLVKEKLHVTVFDGDEKFKVRQNDNLQSLDSDTESQSIWKKLGVPEERIHFYGAEKNWWSRSGTPGQMPIGEIGGPASEIFYDFGEELKIHENSIFKNEKCHPNCQCGRFLEIGNSVFIQYKKIDDYMFEELPQKNVDFGGGLERLTAATLNHPDIFRTDLYQKVITAIVNKYFLGIKDEDFDPLSYPVNTKLYENPEAALEDKNQTKQSVRIIADHIKAATFLIKDGVAPSNKEQGYILRRLLRRSAIKLHKLIHGIITTEEATHLENFHEISDAVIDTYGEIYFHTTEDKILIGKVIDDEIDRFRKTLYQGLREIGKIDQIDGKKAFDLYQTFGFPYEVTEELFRQKGQEINKKEFEEEFKKHQELSRTASAGMFKGGLADHSEQVTKYHTATHLLHAALRQILGTHVEQRGSNITSERLRFDFSHSAKLTEEELKEVKDLVNQKIKENSPVTMEETSYEEAIKSGALAFFKERYTDKVKVYAIGGFSREICGGPHVDFTGKLGSFKIKKEESAGQGVRRIYAILD